MSLAAGPTLLRAGRPYGLLPSLACRLLDNARPNEIVVDAALAAALPPGFDVAEQRPVDLRGIGTHLMAVLAPRRLSQADPAPPTVQGRSGG